MSALARLAVCSWSLQPVTPADLVTKLQATGLSRVQLALDPLRENPSVWGITQELLAQNKIEPVSGMFGCVGEDYSTLESIRETGGIAPDKTWAQNRRNIEATVTLAKRLGLKLVTFHAGFLPHDPTAPEFVKLVKRLGEAADLFAPAGLELALETGQETAPDLLQVLQKLGRKNVGVNFDPANMILYDKGEPVGAARALGPWIRQVHIKDARRTSKPGTWGEEVPAGAGEVDWHSFFDTLGRAGFKGNFVIEREAGGQRIDDIRRAKALVETTFK